MSAREWKPGDVAVVTGRWMWSDPHSEKPAVRRASGWRAIRTNEGVADYEVSDVRPLVVIDPDDAEQVKRLLTLVMHQKEALEGRISRSALTFDTTAAALREFASPTPPKPDEPQGLGAVVEDAGIRYTRWTTGDTAPWIAAFPEDANRPYRYWDGFDAPIILSPGVEVSP